MVFPHLFYEPNIIMNLLCTRSWKRMMADMRAHLSIFLYWDKLAGFYFLYLGLGPVLAKNNWISPFQKVNLSSLPSIFFLFCSSTQFLNRSSYLLYSISDMYVSLYQYLYLHICNIMYSKPNGSIESSTINMYKHQDSHPHLDLFLLSFMIFGRLVNI